MNRESVDIQPISSSPEAPQMLEVEHDSGLEASQLERNHERFLKKRERVESEIHNIKIQKAKLKVGIKSLEESLDWIVNGMSGGKEKLSVNDTSVQKLQAERTLLQTTLDDLQSSERFIFQNYEGLNYRISAIEELGVDLLSEDALEGRNPEEAAQLDILQGKYLAYKECDAKFAEYMKTKDPNGDYSAYIIDQMMLLYTMTRKKEIDRFLRELDEFFPGQVKKEHFTLPYREKISKDIDITKFDSQIEKELALRRTIRDEIKRITPKYLDFESTGLSYSLAKNEKFTIENLGTRGVKRGEKVTQKTISDAMGGHLEHHRGHPFGDAVESSYDRIVSRAKNIDSFVD